MYSPQLETFVKVADAGSFNKAAEELYITSTAVIKQINLLASVYGKNTRKSARPWGTLRKEWALRAGFVCQGINRRRFL